MLKTLIFSFFLITFISCNKDDDEISQTVQKRPDKRPGEGGAGMPSPTGNLAKEVLSAKNVNKDNVDKFITDNKLQALQGEYFKLSNKLLLKGQSPTTTVEFAQDYLNFKQATTSHRHRSLYRSGNLLLSAAVNLEDKELINTIISFNEEFFLTDFLNNENSFYYQNYSDSDQMDFFYDNLRGSAWMGSGTYSYVSNIFFKAKNKNKQFQAWYVENLTTRSLNYPEASSNLRIIHASRENALFIKQSFSSVDKSNYKTLNLIFKTIIKNRELNPELSQYLIADFNTRFSPVLFHASYFGNTELLLNILPVVDINTFAGFNSSDQQIRASYILTQDKTDRIDVLGLNSIMIAAISKSKNKDKIIEVLVENGIDVSALAKANYKGMNYTAISSFFSHSSEGSNSRPSVSSIGGGLSSSSSPTSSRGHSYSSLPKSVQNIISFQDCGSCSALMLAIYNHHVETIETIVNKAKIDLDLKSDAGVVPINFSAKYGNSLTSLKLVHLGASLDFQKAQNLVFAYHLQASFPYLLSSDVKTNKLFPIIQKFITDAPYKRNDTELKLAFAILVNHEKSLILNLLRNHKFEQSTGYNSDQHKVVSKTIKVNLTLLMSACRENNLFMVKEILKYDDIDVNVIDPLTKKTALDYTTNEEIKKLLFDRGAKKGKTLLFDWKAELWKNIKPIEKSAKQLKDSAQKKMKKARDEIDSIYKTTKIIKKAFF
ncbi:ankyrin repeat domain-containing protein [bacterium]|nr:ankyrin repeat domain-containing protein [bacterium]